MIEMELEGSLMRTSPGWYLCAFRASEPRGQDPEQTWRIDGWVPIDDEEATAIQISISFLEVETEQEPLNLVLQNYQRFFGYLIGAPARFDSLIRDTVNPMRRLSTEASTLLFEWLESVRAYLNHTETRLKRSYGKGSKEVIAFKSAAAVEHDSRAFAYRFLSGLRNTGHVAFPPLRLAISEQAGPRGKPHRGVSLSVCLGRDALLHPDFEWKAQVRADIKAQPAEIDVPVLMTTMMQALERIKAAVSAAENDTLVKCAQVLQLARNEVAHIEGTGHLVRVQHPRRIDMLPLN
jgi:hypothetical protein